MHQHYPDLVDAYLESIKKPLKEKKTRGKKKKDEEISDKPKRKYNRKPKSIVIENMNESLKVLELNSSKANVSVSVTKLKRKIKITKKSSQKTIDSFITKKRKKSIIDPLVSLRHSFGDMSLKYSPKLNSMDKKNKVITDKWLSILCKSVDDENDSDLSDIIERMVTKPPTTKTVKVDNKLVRLVFDNYSTPRKARRSMLTKIHNCSTPKDSPRRKSILNLKSRTNSFDNSAIYKVNTSFFFDKLTEDRDAFEMSLHNSAIINLDDTVDYSLPDVCL